MLKMEENQAGFNGHKHAAINKMPAKMAVGRIGLQLTLLAARSTMVPKRLLLEQ
jgi:hypothetical protein